MVSVKGVITNTAHSHINTQSAAYILVTLPHVKEVILA